MTRKTLASTRVPENVEYYISLCCPAGSGSVSIFRFFFLRAQGKLYDLCHHGDFYFTYCDNCVDLTCIFCIVIFSNVAGSSQAKNLCSLSLPSVSINT